MLLTVAVFVRFFLFSTSQRNVRIKKSIATIPGFSTNPYTSFISGFIGGNDKFSRKIEKDDNINSDLPESKNSKDFRPATIKTKNCNIGITEDVNGCSSKPESQISHFILNTLLYDYHHQPESLDWFNVLLAQIINQYRSDARVNGRLVNWLNSLFNSSKKPDILGDIKITELNIGEDFPIFSNCRIHKRKTSSASSSSFTNTTDNSVNTKSIDGGMDSDDLVAEMDVDLSDTITLGIETRVMLSQPRWFNTVMPVSLTVSIVRFSARMIIRITRAVNQETQSSTLSGSNRESLPSNPSPNVQSNNSKNTKLVLRISFNPDFTLEVAVRSLLGARSRLQDMPRIEHIIEGFLRKWFIDRFVDPFYCEIILFRYNTEEKNFTSNPSTEAQTKRDTPNENTVGSHSKNNIDSFLETQDNKYDNYRGNLENSRKCI